MQRIIKSKARSAEYLLAALAFFSKSFGGHFRGSKLRGYASRFIKRTESLPERGKVVPGRTSATMR